MNGGREQVAEKRVVHGVEQGVEGVGEVIEGIEAVAKKSLGGSMEAVDPEREFGH